jgi:hypothetical protein
LSLTAAALMALTAAGGLVRPDLYRDNAFVAAGWFGNDLITLLVATPLLLSALGLSHGHDGKAELIWLGMLDYVLYNYAFYLFGAAFNVFFLAYVALFTLALFALVFGLAGLDVRSIPDAVPSDVRRRGVSLFLSVVVVIGLGGFHVAVALASIASDSAPAIVATVGHPTNVIAALDLSLVVSVSALAAYWLWHGEPWGYVLAAITTVKGAVYMLALSAATLSAVDAGAAGDASAVWLWATIGIGCAAAASMLLWSPLASRLARGGVA